MTPQLRTDRRGAPLPSASAHPALGTSSSEERLALLLEGLPSGVWDRFDLDSGAEWWSPQLFRLLGYPPDAFEPDADSLASVIHPKDRDRVLEAIDLQLDGGGSLDALCRVRTRSGEYRWVHATAAAQFADSGEATRLVGTVTDVHARHLAQSELNRFYNLSVDLVCVVDVDGRFSRISPSFSETLGYSEQELLHRPFIDYVHPDDVEATVEEIDHLSGGQGTLGFQNRYRHRDGRWLWLSWTARPDSAGHIYAIARDVTHDRRASDELARRATELEATNAELQQFAYVASHDLQEPLRTLASYAALVNDRYGAALDDDGREFLTFISEAASRMRTLIRALLEYSRLGRRELTKEVIDTRQVAVGVLQDLHAAIEEAGAEVEIGSLPTIEADPVLFPLVLQNLVANAVKFRGTASPHISLAAERTPVGWRFDVVDNGIGIKDEYRERVFEVFKRLHTRARYEGTGIGLAVCRRIVQQHGGAIWCVDGPDGGSAFRFTIPVSRSGTDRKPKARP